MSILNKVNEINALLQKEHGFDMEVLGMHGGNLLIAGSIDFTYGHSLEIKFEDVFHVAINTEWRTDTSKPALCVVEKEEAFRINRRFKVEQGFLKR